MTLYSRDGTWMYFTVLSGSRQQPLFATWYKLRVSGGDPVRAYKSADAMPYGPNPEMHLALNLA